MNRDIAIKIENVSKQYRLGVVGTGTLSHDLKRWWTVNVRGKEDPYLKIGETNDRATKGSSDYVWALKDINLEIERGDVVGIIGKNGAGKSTLLKLLSRVTKPTTGSIQYNGRIASLLEVGTGFHPEMTGRENIYMNGAIMGMTRSEINRKLDEIIDFAGIERYIDTPVKRYSSGMTVRLGFSIAAHLEPDILVVDEVLAVGDAEFQKKAIGKMQDVSEGGGRTVLFVSHNMGSVEALCYKGILMNKGKVSKFGSITDVIGFYKSLDSGGKQEGKIAIGVFDLSKHKNKVFPKDGLLKAIMYCDNEISEIFYGGCAFKLRISLKNSNQANLRLGFVIKRYASDALIGINNYHLGYAINPGVNKIIDVNIEIPKFPIYKPGRYSIDLYLGNKYEDFEILKDALDFTIESKDVFSTGQMLSPNLNLIYADNIKFNVVE